jgi:hypothetical protein
MATLIRPSELPKITRMAYKGKIEAANHENFGYSYTELSQVSFIIGGYYQSTENVVVDSITKLSDKKVAVRVKLAGSSDIVTTFMTDINQFWEKMQNIILKDDNLYWLSGCPLILKVYLTAQSPDKTIFTEEGHLNVSSAIHGLLKKIKDRWLGTLNIFSSYEVDAYVGEILKSSETDTWINERLKIKDTHTTVTIVPTETMAEPEEEDPSNIYVYEDPPTVGGSGDIGDSNTIYSGRVYWPDVSGAPTDQYTKYNISDGDTIDVYNLGGEKPGSYWIYSYSWDKMSGTNAIKWTNQKAVPGVQQHVYRLRLLGISCEEIDHYDFVKGRWAQGGTKAAIIGGEKARDVLHELIPHGTHIVIDTCNIQHSLLSTEHEVRANNDAIYLPGDSVTGHDPYGRRLGVVYARLKTPRGLKWVNINRTMIARNLALPSPSVSGGQVICHLNGLNGTTSITSWGKDNRSRVTGGVEMAINHHPIVTSFVKEDDRESFLGPFDSDFQVRIGDCQFIIPPEQISVQRISKSERIPILRSRGSLRKDTGQYISRIQMSVYFTGLEQLNGYPVWNTTDKNEPKADGSNLLPGAKGSNGIKRYYVNGLRSFIAQFKRTPFLPIDNSYLNNVHNIQAVALQSLVISTVEGYPDTLKATISLLEFDHMAYMHNDLNFGECFDWPLFRYYYQLALNDHPGYPNNITEEHLDLSYLNDRTFLCEIDNNNRVDEFMFLVVNEIGLMNMRKIREDLTSLQRAKRVLLDQKVRKGDDSFWSNIGNILRQFTQINPAANQAEQIQRGIEVLRTQLDLGPGYLPFVIPDIICTGMSVAYENVLTELQPQMNPLPAYQYMGGSDAVIRARFTTRSEEAVAIFKSLFERNARLIRQYKDLIDFPLIHIRNDYANLFGILGCTIEEFNVHTVPNFPGVYEIDVVFVDFQRTARRMTELQQYACNAFKILDPNKKALYLEELKKRTSLSNKEIETLAIELSETIQPQLEEDVGGMHSLLSYFKVMEALKRIELYPDLELPTYEDLDRVGFYINNTTEYGEKFFFVEPDFYINTTGLTIGEEIRNELYQKGITIKLQDKLEGKPVNLNRPSLYDAQRGIASNHLEWLDGKISLADSDKTESDDADIIVNATNRYKKKISKGNPVKLPLDYIEGVSNRKTGVSCHSIDVYAPSVHRNKFKNGKYVILNNFVKEFAWLGNSAFKIEMVHDINSLEGYPKDAVVFKLYIPNKELCEEFNKRYTMNGRGIKLIGDKAINCYDTVEGKETDKSLLVFVETRSGGEYSKPKMIYLPYAAKNVSTSGEIHAFIGPPTSSVSTGVGNNRGRIMRFEGGVVVDFDRYGVGEKGKLVEGDGTAHTVWLWEIRYNPVTGEVTDVWNVDGGGKELNWKDWIRLISGGPFLLPINVSSSFVIGTDADLANKRAANKIRELIKETDISYRNLESNGLADFAYDFGDGPNNDDANTDPVKMFLGSCHDMITYDKRGRLIRAFPTFHLSFIDEGRVVGQWKLHDNFYGFQALSSMSIHRSRKSVADTCLIELVNAYKTLTDYDNENTDYYGRPTIWEGIEALFLSQDYVRDKIEGRRNEDLKSIMLKTGTRISLRMGYGSDASDLPLVFNGCITELGGEDVVTIIAQGDGIELTNIISARDDASTGTWPSLVSDDFFDNAFNNKIEPRHLVCDMLTTHGGFWHRLINRITSDRFYNYNPLGIMHLGNQNINIYDRYGKSGECGQNIYRGNPNKAYNYDSQGIRIEHGYKWINDNSGDIVFCMSLYNKTPWDIIQACAAVVPDFVAQVIPFGFRSSIFYGRPYFNMIYDYALTTTPDNQPIIAEKKKPFQQLHMYNSFTDIIENQIVASEQDIYTNVIGTYRTMDALYRTQQTETPVIYTDTDIWPEKQKTAVIDTSMICRGLKPLELIGWIPGVSVLAKLINMGVNAFVHEERVAERVARSALRDYLKDMYGGDLLIIGDPTVKPRDLVYLADWKNEMSGLCEVKEVVHHFSERTGFVTTIVPDLCVVNQDAWALFRWNWIHSLLAPVSASLIASVVGKMTLRSLKTMSGKLGVNLGFNFLTTLSARSMAPGLGKAMSDGLFKFGSGRGVQKIATGIKNLTSQSASKILNAILGPDEAAKLLAKLGTKVAEESAETTVKAAVKGAVSWADDAAKIVARGAAGMPERMAAGFASGGVIGFIIEMIVCECICASIGEAISRKARNRESVVMFPLKKKGSKFVAGIQGHMGSVYGDVHSSIDKLIEKITGWLDWIFPGAGVKYNEYRDTSDYIDRDAVLALSYADKVGAGVTSSAEEQMNNREGAEGFSSKVSAPRAVADAYFRMSGGNLVPVKLLSKAEQEETLLSFMRYPPGSMPNNKMDKNVAAQKQLYTIAAAGLSADELYDMVYIKTNERNKLPKVNKVNLREQRETKTGLIIVSSGVSSPLLTIKAYRNLCQIIYGLQKEFKTTNVALKISSAMRTPEATWKEYYDRGHGYPEYDYYNSSNSDLKGKKVYRFSDHSTANAVDISAVIINGKTYSFSNIYNNHRSSNDTKAFTKDSSGTIAALYRVMTGMVGIPAECIWGPHNDIKGHWHHFHVTLWDPEVGTYKKVK